MVDKKVVLITGSTRGIGKAIALGMARAGYAVVMNARQQKEDVAEAIKTVKICGNPVLYVKGDLASAEDRKRMLQQTLDQFGRIDVLVNNAGVGPKIRTDLLETTEESMDYVLGINLRGTFFLTQSVAKAMLRHIQENTGVSPVIVNISSMSAYTSSTNRGEYCISKAGVSMITKLFADRLADHGIRVFEIRPGIIETELTSLVRAKYQPLIETGIAPIKRWGQPEDIAAAVEMLCGRGLFYSTGDVINVDGGFHLRRL